MEAIVRDWMKRLASSEVVLPGLSGVKLMSGHLF
jgi:hypothetical protein